MIGANLKGINKKSIVKIIQFSIFVDERGPTPIYIYPKSIDQINQLNIAMKSISLLMGEGAYQSGYDFENLKYFGILPFPDTNMVGITYFFLIKDENARGKAKASTISILVDEHDGNFLYENIKTLRVLIDRTALKLNSKQTDEEIGEIMDFFRDELEHFDLSDPSASKMSKTIKMVFTGLDGSGKSSFLRSVEKRYSELMGIAPTKGIERREQKILGTSLLEWDFGGQENYRLNYFKNAEMYLTDIDILFFIIDVQDKFRVEEAQSYLHQILTTLESFKQYPPIIPVFHKWDPDIRNDQVVDDRIKEFEDHLISSYKKWNIKTFKTTIFDHWTIISAFSYGISQLSPNREIFRAHLKWITKKMGGNASLLIGKNAIILSDYSDDWQTGRFFEFSQSYFCNLFLNFEEFQMLQNDYITWEFGTLKIVLKKFYVENREFYILFQLKDERLLDKLDDYLEKFKMKIQPLLEHYL